MTLISPLSPSAPTNPITTTGGDMSTTTHTTDTTPRVWIDAASADQVTTYDVHGAHSRADSHAKLWCFDHENLPVKGELDPLAAAAWGQCLAEVDDSLRPALCAWVESEGTGDLPSISDFLDSYQGHWESFEDYAENLADVVGLLAGVPEEIANYFDWDSWTRDLAFDHSTYDDPEGGVFVFRVI